jgi:Rrf2 family protein
MKISKKTQYGLRAMVYLAKQKGKICSLREISKKERIPFNFLEKIFSKLETKNLISSKKGKKGGYFLAKAPEKIKIGEIINTLEGEKPLVKCLESFCPREKKCLAKNFWKKLNYVTKPALNSITLSDLII